MGAYVIKVQCLLFRNLKPGSKVYKVGDPYLYWQFLVKKTVTVWTHWRDIGRRSFFFCYPVLYTEFPESISAMPSTKSTTPAAKNRIRTPLQWGWERGLTQNSKSIHTQFRYYQQAAIKNPPELVLILLCLMLTRTPSINVLRLPNETSQKFSKYNFSRSPIPGKPLSS